MYDCWGHIERYNRYLTDIDVMLADHVVAVDRCIEELERMQKEGGKKAVNLGPDEREKRGGWKWKRERFQPQRYRDLCERAMEELGGE